MNYYSAANIMIENSTCTLRRDVYSFGLLFLEFCIYKKGRALSGGYQGKNINFAVHSNSVEKDCSQHHTTAVLPVIVP